jgi:putative Mn2+ efflux pump MntP
MWQAIALSFGLAMDATAVSAARGLANRRRELAILPVMFGGFQSGMAALGWLLGAYTGPFLARWNYWVAFVLLALIGAKMMLEAWTDDDGDDAAPAIGSLGVYLGLAIATSLDAAAAGLTLPLVPVDPWVAVVLIGSVTSACSIAAFLGGRALGKRAGKRLEMLGGAVLIGIGIEILVSGLSS